MQEEEEKRCDYSVEMKPLMYHLLIFIMSTLLLSLKVDMHCAAHIKILNSH